jgi:hypothetical protein
MVLDAEYPSGRVRMTIVVQLVRWGAALLAILEWWGDSSLVLDDDGELVGWLQSWD